MSERLRLLQRQNRLLDKQLASLRTKSASSKKDAVLGVPFARSGESVMSSRPYSYVRLIQAHLGHIHKSQAKQELMVSDRLSQQMANTAYQQTPNAVMAPLSTDFLEAQNVDRSFCLEMKSMLGATQHADPDEMNALAQRAGLTTKAGTGPQAWLTPGLGSEWVPFPQFGELLPLLRNKSAILSLDVNLQPMPPQGSIAFPRETTAAVAGWVGEGNPGSSTQVGSDSTIFRAKTLMSLVTLNNQLLRMGGPAVEQLVRNNMAKSIDLVLDNSAMVGQGSTNAPQGLVGYSGVTSLQSSVSANNTANGITLAPQDLGKQFIATIQAHNADFTGWALHPTLFWAMAEGRASVLGSGDQLGLFLWSITRALENGQMVDRIKGFKASVSANVPTNRTLGSGTGLTCMFGGDWPKFYVGMYGAIEFATADQTGNNFSQYQTTIRAVLNADLGPMYPGAFCYIDGLQLSVSP